jgi:predicted DCC family thiol-disulfide oxidoreductase YuxK
MKNFCLHDSDISEMTEIKEAQSDSNDKIDIVSRPRGWILYDADCRFCTASAKRFQRLFRRRGFYFLPLQTPWVRQRLGSVPGAPLEEMRVLRRDGEDFGGVDALIFLARQIWWARPLCTLAKLPRVHGLIDSGYRWVARHRGCTHAACSHRPSARRWVRWIGIGLLPLLAWAARNQVSPWALMWLMAGALFLGCKWLTFRRVWRERTPLHLERLPGYFIFWAGMDAASFLGSDSGRGNLARHTRRIILAITKVLSGAIALFVLARLASNPLLAGWIGMVGMILILHFGLFELAGVAWQIAGVPARPIMNAPIKATSLNEFWGRRWNGAFNQLMVDLFFRRFARSLGTTSAVLIAFVISGLIHELVISLPARAGYGWPTLYFLVQGLGVIAQRSLGMRRGFTGWFSTMAIAAGPAFWLFHPPFVRQVVLPFMQTIHAL